MRQRLSAIKKGQTFHHGRDKIRVRLKKPIERFLNKLVGAPTVTRRELNEASFLFRHRYTCMSPS